MSWAPIDNRLIDHPNLLRLSKAVGCRHKALGLVVHLWGLLHDLNTELLDGSADELEELYGWPAGWISNLEAVGWAVTKKDSCRFPTRNHERVEQGSKRSAAASKAANARWDAQRRRASKRIPNASSDAYADASCGSDASMPHREKERTTDASTHTAADEGGGSVERPIRIADIRQSLRQVGAIQ